jgi:hypothetical protein
MVLPRGVVDGASTDNLVADTPPASMWVDRPSGGVYRRAGQAEWL